jgi:predicted dehydrogenase
MTRCIAPRLAGDVPGGTATAGTLVAVAASAVARASPGAGSVGSRGQRRLGGRDEEQAAVIGLVQVGLGGWGRDWATRVLPSVKDVELLGCVDVHAPALAAAVKAGVVDASRCYGLLAEALDELDPAAVLVTTDLPSHIPAVMAALQRNKHVLVEKPFAPTLEEARRAVALASELGLTLMVSQNYRFFPAVRAVQQLLRERRLGELVHVDLDFRRFSAPNPARLGHRAWREPLLLDMSIHHFDLLRAVTGLEPTAIECRTWNPAWSGFVDPPEGIATIELGGDVTVSYRGSWLVPDRPTPWAGEWRMELEHGELWWTSRADLQSPSADAAFVYDHAAKRTRLVLPQLALLDRAGALDAFAAAVRAGSEPESSGRENIGSLALTHAAIESARRGERVSLDQMATPAERGLA